MRRQQQENSKLSEIQSNVLRQVHISDYYHMMYLKPIQCMLQQKQKGLPKGLKIVQRKNDMQYQARPIKPILSHFQFSNLTSAQLKQLQEKDSREFKQPRSYKTYKTYCIQNNADNLLCQMKIGSPVQIAICVCMYNEDKEMLNNTLLGIGQNIAKLCQDGVDPDKIVVIIVQDGIEKMDKSILELFQVLQAESGIRFGSTRQKKLEAVLDQIQEIQHQREEYSFEDEDKILNLNCFLFTKQQEQNRKRLRFTNVKKEYDEIKNLYVEIGKLQNDKKVTHEYLPQFVLTIFKQECKKFVLGDRANDDNTEQTLNRCFNEVASDLNKSRPLIQNALTKASQYCKQYIESRLEMSHVSFFRTSNYFPDDSEFNTGALSQIKFATSTKLLKIPSDRQDERENLIQSLEEKNSIKMNIFFVVKYKNAQKLSSHNWFFNGFCQEFSKAEENKSLGISPKYTILLDVGLRPGPQALRKMYYSMDNHKDQIGGVCGYMGLKLERTGQTQDKMKQDLDFFTRFFLLFVDIQRAQQLEYHFAHLIDKGFESIFKFIHVLPGAFSGYNMKAIWGQQNNESKSDELLQNYFKSIGQKVNNKKFQQLNLSFWKILARVLLPNFILKCIEPNDKTKQTYEKLMYESNVYLAEDRILCMGIHKNGYDLMFLPDAYSLVDPVKDLPSLMGQRKRWINGSYFAFQKVSNQFSEVSCCQVVNLQIWYMSLMNMLAFIAPGFFLFSISVAMQAFKADVLINFFQNDIPQTSPIYNAFVYTINFIYAMLIFGLIYFSMSLTNRNKKFVRFVYGVSTILGIMSMIMLVIIIVDLARGLSRGSSYLISNQSSDFIQSIPGGQATVDAIRYVVLGIMGLYALPLLLYSILFCNIRVIFEVIAGALSFAFYTPTYLIILNIYSLCRMDDLSWGTKGLEAGQSKDAAVLNTWKIIRTIHVGKLLFWNILTAGLLIHFGSDYLIRFYLTFALMGIIASTMAFKVFCGILYYFYYKIAIKNKKIFKKQQQKQRKFASNKYIATGSTLIKEPSLYKILKSKVQNTRSLIDQLKDEIKQNIKNLNDLASGQSGEPNMMAMQLMGLMPSRRSTVQRQSMISMISGIVSINQKKSNIIKNALHKLRNHLPSIVTPNSRQGNQSFSNQSGNYQNPGCFDGFFSRNQFKKNQGQGYLPIKQNTDEKNKKRKPQFENSLKKK